ncbi:MAG: BT_3928 family protein [Breznakibacter sp.]
MNLLLKLSRYLLAAVFIFSGFVKAIDPTGGAIKIEDYFNAFGLSTLNPISFTLSVLLALAEFMVGYLLLLKIQSKLASLGALIFMGIFTPLTLYIAIFNPVSDCGCFGDAIKLSNWATFYKDLALLPLSIFVFIRHKSINSPVPAWKQWAIGCWGILIIFFVVFHAMRYEPLIDFRPYAVGTDIKKGMSTPEDAEQPEYETTFILEKGGVRQEFDVDNYPYNDSTWVFVDSKTKVIREGYQPPIKDFVLQNAQGDNVNDRILNSFQPVLLVVAPKLEKMEKGAIDKLMKLSHFCLQHNIQSYVATSSLQSDIDRFDQREQIGITYLTGDETMLKTILRSNPGFLIIQNGTIVGKYNLNNLPSEEKLLNPLSTSLDDMRHKNMQLMVLTLIFASMILVITLNKNNKH